MELSYLVGSTDINLHKDHLIHIQLANHPKFPGCSSNKASYCCHFAKEAKFSRYFI